MTTNPGAPGQGGSGNHRGMIQINPKTAPHSLRCTPMSAPRSVRRIARWVLMAFGLSLGLAIASPMVNPRAMALVCSGAGLMKLVSQTDDATAAYGSPTLDCPLCAEASAPPPVLELGGEPVLALSFFLLPRTVARLASLLRGPWQARAPPAAA